MTIFSGFNCDDIKIFFDKVGGGAEHARNSYNVTPDFLYKHVKGAIDVIKDKPEENQILILKSWNECTEGNYMEPDLQYGKGFINVLRKAIEDFK